MSDPAVDSYDVVVVGAGPAGENAAGRCADGGLSVAVVERELVGGECSYWGCIPSKVLIRPGDVLAAARRVRGAREAVTGNLDVAQALARRDEATSDWDDQGQLPWLAEHHVALLRGTGRLAGPRIVEVTDSNRAVRRIAANRAVVLATGTRAVVPPIAGLQESAPWDNRGITAARTVPGRLLVLGGGAIGTEMAQAFARLGSAVAVVEGADRLLAREEPFAGEQVRSALEADGVQVVTGVPMTEVVRAPSGSVHATLGDGRELVADEILVAVGRRPATSDLGLDTVGLHPGSPVEVDDRLRAVGLDGDWLYAVGDCNGRALLTHVGKYQARIAGDVILGKDVRDEVSRDMVPRVIFTDPQVCAVGLTKSQADERGIEVSVVDVDTGSVAGSYTQGDGIAGTCRLVIDSRRRVLVGATFTGPGLADLLHSATVAIAGQVTVDRLWHAVPSFPTVSEVWLRLLEGYGL